MFQQASNAASKMGNAAARFVGKATGKYLTESDYNTLSAETRELTNSFDINILLQKGKDNNEKIKILLAAQKVIENTLKYIYPQRLNYLVEKQRTNPSNPGTPGKIAAIQEIIPKLDNILLIVKAKLNELDPNGSEQQKIKDAFSNAANYSLGTGTSDPIDIMLFSSMNDVDGTKVIEGLGSILGMLGHFAGEILSAALNSGGKSRRKRSGKKSSRNGKKSSRNGKKGSTSKSKHRKKRTCMRKK